MITTDTTRAGTLFALCSKHYQKKTWHSDQKAQVYLFKITHLKGRKKVVNDTFLKIGFTTQAEIESRIAYLPTCFSVEVLETAIFDKVEAYRLEQALHRHYTRYSYTPKYSKWGGSQECYKLTLIDEYPTLKDLIEGLETVEEAVQSPTNL